MGKDKAKYTEITIHPQHMIYLQSDTVQNNNEIMFPINGSNLDIDIV